MSAIIPPPGQDSFGAGRDVSAGAGAEPVPSGAYTFMEGMAEVAQAQGVPASAPWDNQATDMPTDTKPDITVNKGTPEGGPVEHPVTGRQWLRNWRITMGSSSGESLDLSKLRMRFKVSYETMQHPTYIDVTITNVSEQTANKIDKENIPVTLECGYENRLQLIFKGEAAYKRYGRETPTETYLQIIAKSGRKAYNHAHVSKTLAAGHTFKDQVKVATDAMKEHGVELGHIADLDPRKFPRAITLHGMAREVLRRVALANDASWTIHNGKVQMIKNKEGIPGGNVIVINSDTGMIGRPVQTFKGIEVRTLLNPQIGPGSKIKIDEKSIERVSFTPTRAGFQAAQGGGLTNVPLTMAQPLSSNGEYTVTSVEHTGDTRGQEWYTDIVCYDPKTPSAGAFNSDNNLAAQPYMGMPVIEQQQQQGGDKSAGGT